MKMKPFKKAFSPAGARRTFPNRTTKNWGGYKNEGELIALSSSWRRSRWFGFAGRWRKAIDNFEPGARVQA